MIADLATNEVVITAAALPVPASERLVGVTVIGAETLHQGAPAGLELVLKGAAGVQLFRRSDARSGHPSSQGVTLRALGGNAASRALLILDGVPQTDPFSGWINWPAYNAAFLQQVRVIRGGGSVTEGPGALAGNIHLLGGSSDGLDASARIGSDASVGGDFAMGQGIGGGRLTLTGYAAAGRGFVPAASGSRGPADRRAPFANVGGRARLVRELGSRLRLEAVASGFVDQRERGLAFTGNRTQGQDLSLRLLKTGPWAGSLLLYGQRRQFHSSFASTDAKRTIARQTSLQYNVPGRALGWSAEVRPPVGDALELRVGTDGRLMRGRSEELASFVDGLPTRDRQSGGRSGHAGLFAELTHSRGDLTLSAAGRVDRWFIADGELRERLLSNGANNTDERFAARHGWLPTGRAGASVAVSPEIRARSAAYLGWRLPTLSELFRPFRAGADATVANPLLKPERLRGAEAGVEWNRGAVTLSGTAFLNRLDDPVVNVTLNSGPGTFPGVGFVAAGGAYRQRQNSGAVRVKGMELAGQWRLQPWSLSGNLSLTDARIRSRSSAPMLDGLRPAQTPSLLASVRAAWERQGRSIGAELRYNGRQYEDDLNSLRLPAATTVDLFGSLPVSRHLTLSLLADNLLNAKVVTARTRDGFEERATPRTFWLTARAH